MDGLGVGAPLSGGGGAGYLPDIANAQEVTFTTSGGLGEAEVGGPTMNIVPKTGGNTVRGTIYAAGVNNTVYTMGGIYPTLPAGCMTPSVNGVSYYLCGNNWFLPSYGANGVYYRVVAAP